MEELKAIENELVPVYETDKGEMVVYGLELHKVLGVKSPYREWSARRFNDIEAVENKEFEAVEISTPSGQVKKNHIIKLNTAKEMAMLERNDKGKQVRRYFIAVEEKFKEVVQTGALHNVKQLTVTSRDIAVMIGDRKKHSLVLREIRECITELEDMGFSVPDFFIESSYTGGNNQGGRAQYLCTERGCERFSWRLEPREREVFIREFADRFERMRAVLEGRPVKVVEFNEKSQTVIRLYENNDWGILLMDNEVYNLTPKEIEMTRKVVPALKKKGVRDIKRVLCVFLENMDRDGKLKEIASWGIDRVEEPQKIGMPCQQTQSFLLDGADTPRRKLQKNADADLDKVVNLTMEEAKTRYSIGTSNLTSIADNIGAIVRIGRKKLFARKILDEYFDSLAH